MSHFIICHSISQHSMELLEACKKENTNICVSIHCTSLSLSFLTAIEPFWHKYVSKLFNNLVYFYV